MEKEYTIRCYHGLGDDLKVNAINKYFTHIKMSDSAAIALDKTKVRQLMSILEEIESKMKQI